jgi:hypothetical protein
MQVIGTVEIWLRRPDATHTLMVAANSTLARHVLDGLETPHSSTPHDTRIFHLVANGFNYSPELAINNFFSNGAGMLALLSLFAMFLMPVGKSLVWIYLFFVPLDEKTKGWVLTFLDFSGKWQFAYLYLMAIQAVAMAIHHEIFIPLPGGVGVLQIIIREGFSWSGTGGRFFVLACVLSLVLGQLFLVGHQYAVAWEEDVRRERLQHIPRRFLWLCRTQLIFIGNRLVEPKHCFLVFSVVHWYIL